MAKAIRPPVTNPAETTQENTLCRNNNATQKKVQGRRQQCRSADPLIGPPGLLFRSPDLSLGWPTTRLVQKYGTPRCHVSPRLSHLKQTSARVKPRRGVALGWPAHSHLEHAFGGQVCTFHYLYLSNFAFVLHETLVNDALHDTNSRCHISLVLAPCYSSC